jgi:citrate synthase
MTDKAQATEDGQAKADGAESLTVTDNRTGETYEMEITDGTVRAMDFREIKVNDDDFGLMTYDPGYSNTASCRSAITYIDGENGVLEHRGIPIEQLAENSTFLEVSYLLLYGHLPTEDELNQWIYEITHHTYVHENIKELMSGFRHDANPMGMLLASVGALSTFYPEAMDVKDNYQRHVSAVRLIAKMPTLAAFAYRRSLGLPYVYPDNDLTYTGNFLSMLFKMAEPSYVPDPRIERKLPV